MDILLAFWQRVSLLGTQSDFPDHLNRKLVLGNRVAALSALLVFAMGFLYIRFPFQFLTYVIGDTFCLLLLVFNYLGKVNFSRLFFMIGMPLFLALGVMVTPEAIQLPQKMALLSSVVIPLVLFGITEKKFMMIGLVWTVFCFFAVDFLPIGMQQERPPESNLVFNPKVVGYLGAVVSFSVFIATFIYLQRLNLTAETQLKDMLVESNQQKKEIETQKQRLENANRTLNVKALTAQLNPHFLYNSLNSIQHFLTVNDKTSSLTYLSKFGRLIRQFLDYSDAGLIPLSEELKLLNYYLELECLRFDSAFTYSVEVEDDLLLYPIEVPLLLIQIHVENAILHGLVNKESDDRILLVKFTNESGYMRCLIEDNGIGRKASAERKSKRLEKFPSKGIEISTKRLELMYADFEGDYLIKITDLHQEGNACGTRIELRIPFESN